MRFREIESIILADGWRLNRTAGSHFQYVHPIKKGIVTIPQHHGDVSKGTVQSILKQAGLK